MSAYFGYPGFSLIVHYSMVNVGTFSVIAEGERKDEGRGRKDGVKGLMSEW